MKQDFSCDYDNNGQSLPYSAWRVDTCDTLYLVPGLYPLYNSINLCCYMFDYSITLVINVLSIVGTQGLSGQVIPTPIINTFCV